MKKLFIYMITGIILGVLVAFIPLTLHSSLLIPTEQPEGYGHEYIRTGELEKTGIEKMQILPFFSFILGEVFILVVPALIVAFVIYQFLMKRRGKLQI